jgi:hypothetical protein
MAATNLKMNTEVCKRCGGKGFRHTPVAHLGVPGLCYDCDGDGTRATQLKKRAAEKARKALDQLYIDAQAKTYAVREANGGAQHPPRDRRHAAYELFGAVVVFTTDEYATSFRLSKTEAWIELCRWTAVYPRVNLETKQVDGWEFSK